MPDFQLVRDRDAWFVLRGFRYQIDLSILRWLQLQNNQLLQLEYGEDIDIVSRALTGSRDEIGRELEQVKHLEKNISIRSDACKAALANAHSHQMANPNSSITFRFCTNASAATERPSPFDDRQPAILAWENIRLGSNIGNEKTNRIIRIHGLLTSLSKPNEGVDNHTWKLFNQFVTAATTSDIEEFINHFEWSCGLPASDDIANLICQHLMRCGHCGVDEEATDLHSRLFLYVMRLISQRGLKQLDCNQLNEVLALPTLGENDRALLNLITTEVFTATERLDQLESQVESHSHAIAQVNRQLFNQIHGIVVTPRISSAIANISFGPPPLVNALSERSETVNEFQSALAESRWLAINGSVGTGKTHLMTLLSQRQEEIIYISMRDLSSDECLLLLESFFRQLTYGQSLSSGESLVENGLGRLATSTVIFLDDLPRLIPGDQLSRYLLAIEGVCRRLELKVVSSSHFEFPQSIKNQFPDGFNEQAVPSLTTDEIRDVLVAIGAEEELIESRLAERLKLATSGHATIVAAVARLLSLSNWENSNNVNAIVDLQTANTITAETIHRLVHTVEDDSSRELLYRLCHILGNFSIDEVNCVCSVSPELARPRERLAALDGLWVERQNDEMLSVCPLVKPIADTEVSNEVKISVWSALGELICSRQSLSVFDVAKVASYFDKSNQRMRLALFLYSALSSCDSLPDEQLYLLYALTWPDRRFPDEVDSSLCLLIRAQQIGVAKRLGQSTAFLIQDSERQISSAADHDAWAVYGYSVQILFHVSSDDFDYGLRLCGRIISMNDEVIEYRNQITSDAGVGALGPDFPSGTNFVWLILTGIKTPDDFLNWLNLLRSLSSDDLADAFGSDLARDGCQLCLNRVWLFQLQKDEQHRDWDGVMDALEQAIEFGRSTGTEIIWIHAIRVKFIVLTEYLGRNEQAHQLASSILDSNQIGTESRFLLLDVIGRSHRRLGNMDSARELLNDAVEIQPNSYLGIKLRSFLELSCAWGDECPSLAIEFAEKSVRVANLDSVQIHDLELVTALGELSIAKWAFGDAIGAYEALDQAAERLLLLQDRSDDWKIRFVLLGNTLSEFGTISATGSPRPTANFAQATRGCFLGHNVGLVELFDREHYDDFGEVTICTQLSLFAGSLRNEHRATDWALRGIEHAREGGSLAHLFVLGDMITPVLIRQGDFASSLDVAMESSIAHMAARKAEQEGTNAVRTRLNSAEVLGEKPSNDWNLAEKRALYSGVMPAFFWAGLAKLRDSESGHNLSSSLSAECRRIASTASNPDAWIEIADVIDDVFSGQLSGREIHTRGNEAIRENNEIVYDFAYLGSTFADDCTLENAIRQHAIVFQRIVPENIGEPTKFMIQCLFDFWEFQLASQRFRFSSPQLLERELRSICDTTDGRHTRMMLKMILNNLGVSFSDRFHYLNNWLNES